MITAVHVLASQEDTLSTFGHDPWWLIGGKAVAIFAVLVLITLLMMWVERRGIARMQQRLGPNRVGPYGLGQGLADGIKLALKEDIIPAIVDKPVYLLAPVLAAMPAFMAFGVIPLGSTVSIAGHVTRLQLSDLPVAVLYVLAMSSIGVYGIILAGWSSGSTYPLLGGLRSAAQVISYEVALGLSLVAVFLQSGSLSTAEIVNSQAHQWAIITTGVVPFAIYCVSAVGETNRAPFDLPEAEGELVGGFHTEYSSLKFAMFFLAEYINMTTVSALATTMFLGGWRPFWPFSLFGWADNGWVTLIWFFLKLSVLLFGFVWVRATLPRLRYDQFMSFGWKRLIPLALVWLLIVASLRVISPHLAANRTRLIQAVVGLLVLALLLSFWPQKAPPPAVEETGPVEFDPFAGGFPVPPLPGQVLPGAPVEGRQEVTGG
ncbi:MAG: NADH-quinone oxidoreductase subunit [Frankiaceae bacterium]|nr:NADH-quinone oxidoreductase subunit [Frankiaceae bacterium]MDX6225198.1 NADH-quinone oxidoreductase subunit [Frankiales bacterium]MDX6272895.1 NADH-quinone oxidoreductase subunit [Frankiales bacterium]